MPLYSCPDCPWEGKFSICPNCNIPAEKISDEDITEQGSEENGDIKNDKITPPDEQEDKNL